jgi:hypothetical protein
MLVRILFLVAWLGSAPRLPAQVVQKLNGPLAGNVSRFTWTPDGRYVLYGAERNTPDIDVLASVRVSDGGEAVYDPYASFLGSASTAEFVLLPVPELVGVRYYTYDGMSFPPVTAAPLHVLERDTGLPVTVTGALSPSFLDDGRMLYRTSFTAFRGSTYERAWIGRWDGASPPLEISPPVQPDNHVSLVLHAPRAAVAVFGWRDTLFSANDAELLAVPLVGGAPVSLTPPPSGSQRTWVDLLHVRSSDELAIYLADEAAPGLIELWAVPVDGAQPPRRLNPPLPLGRSLYDATLSRDEARVVFVSDVEAYQEDQLWSTDVDSGASRRLSGPMVPGGDVGHGDFWIGPDGARVVYRADQRADGILELFSAPLDGHAPAVRLHPELPVSSDALRTVHFTPDGRWVVFALRLTSGALLLVAPADASRPPRILNWPFPQGGGVVEDSSGILSTVAIAPGGRQVFFLGEQDADGVAELYSVPIDGSAPPRKWSTPLVAGGDVTAFAPRPTAGAVLYRADQDVDERFELYLSELPDAPPPHSPSGPPPRKLSTPAGD